VYEDVEISSSSNLINISLKSMCIFIYKKPRGVIPQGFKMFERDLD